MLNHAMRLFSGVGVFMFFCAIIAGYFLYPYWKAAQPALITPPQMTFTDAQLAEVFTIHPDFTLSVFSEDVINPRVLLADGSGNILVSEPSEGRISLLNQDRERTTLIEGLNRPHGLALSDGKLYVAETGQVLSYEYSNGAVSEKIVLLDLPNDGRHWTRTIGIGPDGGLYISVGSSCNICQEADWRRDKILRYDLEKEELQEYAVGLRNAVFFTWDPESEAMMATEMGRDWLGDNLPPDELNVIVQGGDYGFPYCYGNKTADPEYNNPQRCSSTLEPLYLFQAHEAPLGIDFFQRNAIIALHGSWNRKDPVGYEVIRLLKDDGYQKRETLLSGFLKEDGSSIGRPAGVLTISDRDILISDDRGNKIYQLTAKQEANE